MIRVIGGGLSGLFAAYALKKCGHEVELFEKSQRLGGMIQTLHLPWGLVETAANGMLNSQRVEELSRDIGVDFLPMQSTFKKRYIYRDRALRMPLSKLELMKFTVGLFRRQRPLPGETLWDYSHRSFGMGATRYLVEPAAMGVFGTESMRLSATLVYDYFITYKSARPRGTRGTVAPAKGMGEIAVGLEKWLEKAGTQIHRGQPGQISDSGRTVIATDATTAADLLQDISPVSAQLKHIQYQPLYSVTLGFHSPGSLKGFGCLFPRAEGFTAMGVLFNSYIFAGRGPLFNETWILPAQNLTEQQAYEAVLTDRKRLMPREESEPAHKMITHWARALPIYDTVLERFLQSQSLPPNIQLLGNYTGRLGLAKILDQAFEMAEAAR